MKTFYCQRSPPACCWSILVPSKVDIFGPRASMNRIPSKSGLGRTNIIMDTAFSHCGFHDEIANHILLNFSMADNIWYYVVLFVNGASFPFLWPILLRIF